MTDEPEKTIPIIEEDVTLDKRRVATGRVRVRTETEHEEATVSDLLEGEAVDIERIPFDTQIDTVPEVRSEGDLTIVPVVEEVLIVEKRLVLREEVHIRRRRTEEEVSVPVTLRRQRAVVDHLPPDPEAGDPKQPRE
jgi:uncharacterized protein (TIGR02271 family)